MKDFETEYRKWLNGHLAKRRGERLRMLKEQHGYGEKLLLEQAWWPVVGNFDNLHPEYEVVDEDGNRYYLDYAYVRFPRPTGLESDGFNPHARDADRHTFKKGRRRQNAILLDGWHILRFSTDDLKDDPEYCRTILRRMLERWYGEDQASMTPLTPYQREVVRLATRASKPITPNDVVGVLGMSGKFSRRLLHQLVDLDVLEPASGHKRVTKYRLKKTSGTAGR